MKLTSYNFKSYISGGSKNISGVIVYGYDQGLISVCIDQIKAIYLGEQYNKDQVFKVEADLLKKDNSIFFEKIYNFDFLSPGNLIIHIYDPSLEVSSNLIKEYLNSLNDNVFLIVEATVASSKHSIIKFCESHKSFGSLSCYQDNDMNLKTIIMQELAAKSYFISSDALNYLSSNLGNDRLITKQELTKLMIYKKDSKNIDLQDVLQTTSYNANTFLSKVIFAIFSNNKRDLYNSLNVAKAEISDIGLIRALIKHVHQILSAKLMIAEKGLSIDEAMFSIYPPILYLYKESFRQQLYNLSINKVHQILIRLTLLELNTKEHPSISYNLISKFTLTI